ncbi:MAG: HAMP domain-containing histidine kinase [Coriobacteriales bacterium]|jgi:two-component system sensor histidine kinase VanS|nr:HAMP domain-containing histidine kinase [Coriobacteriales bacterium]
MNRNGLFFKTFLYTAVFAILLVSVTAFLFSAQIVSYYRMQNTDHVTRSYQRIVTGAQDGVGLIESAKRFYEKNQSLPFIILDKDGTAVYATPGFDWPGINDDPPPNISPDTDTSSLVPGDGVTALPLTVYSDNEYEIIVPGGDFADYYDGLTLRVVVAVLAILGTALLCAFVFARQITKPIKTLADVTGKMANLEEVSLPPKRADELGGLTEDVHSLYVKLKDEILRTRELEEAQRHFFLAASHELKTPVAATTALLEGMLENVGEYKDHPLYLRECLKLMDAQSDLVSEILEIVALRDGEIVPVPEKLDIAHTVGDVLSDIQALADANGRRLVVKIPDGHVCLADANMLKKALSNVIVNAVQNTASGSEIRIGSEASESHCRLCILNTGARIDEAVLPMLFDPFYRVDKARSRKSGGSGLGLTIVKRTLDAMGFDFALENAPDGVLFWVDVPKG